MLSKEWLQGCKMMADAGVMFQSDAVKSLLDHIAELEENATAQALALKAAKAMQQAETERADKMELRLEAVRALFFGAVPSNDELDISISHARNNNP